MSLSSKVPATSVFELKSAALTVLALQLKTPELASLAEALAARYGATPGLFEHEPLCVDLSLLRDEAELPDFDGLVALLRRHGFNPMAARGGNPEQMAAALSAGLAEAPDVSQPRPEAVAAVAEPVAAEAPAAGPEVAGPAQAELPLAEPAEDGTPAPVPAAEAAAPASESAEPSSAPAPALAPATVIIDKPLRSGQQVYARGADLIVLAVVSFGAEVIADGSIHVYAPLRGRAIAGAQGDTQARIFAACMEPQLVSIAGTWRTTEAGLPPEVAGKPAQVRLDGDKLLFEPLKF